MSVSSAEAGLLILDTGLYVRWWDTWLAEATGVASEAAQGQALQALFPDIAERGLLPRLERVVSQGTVDVLAPAFHHYLIRCRPRHPVRHYAWMQQRVTMAPLREGEAIVGAIIAIEDVTERLERERATRRAGAEEEIGPQVAGADRRAPGEGAADDVTVQTLAGALHHEQWEVRRAAASGLGQAGGQAVLARLIHALRHEYRNLNVLNSALQALTLLDAESVAPIAALLDDPDAELRVYAALALGQVSQAQASLARPSLLHALDDPDANVRYHAIEGLGKLQASEAVERLAAIAETRDFFLAFPALDALARIGEPWIAPRLVPLLGDPLLSAAAVDALGVLGDAAVVGPLARLLDHGGAPAGRLASALAILFERYEQYYGEGSYIADLARQALSPHAVGRIVEALEHSEGADLHSLATVLGWLEGPEVDAALAGLLGRPEVSREVVAALVRHGPSVTQLLIDQLAAEELELRQAAITALGRIGDAHAVPRLIEILTGEPDLMIMAAGALASIGDHSALEGLLDMMEYPDAAVRQAVVGAINSLGHPELAARIAARLTAADPRVRESAARVAGYFGYPEYADELLALCQDPVDNVRRAVVEHLPYLEDERALPALLAALERDTPKVRLAAARALADVDAGLALPALLRALADPDPWVRYAATRAIGQHREATALDRLAAAAQHDAAGQVRIAAAEALGQIGSPSAIPILAPLVDDPNTDVARSALYALGNIPYAEALPPLLHALSAVQSERRAAACQAIGALGEHIPLDPSTVTTLQWVAGADPVPLVFESAVAALGRLGTPEAIAALIALAADPQRRAACVATLVRLGAKQAAYVAKGLNAPQPAVRGAVVEALAQMKNPEASAWLSQALDHPDPRVRGAACAALARLGSLAAERKLAILARTDPDPAVRAAADQALRRSWAT